MKKTNSNLFRLLLLGLLALRLEAGTITNDLVVHLTFDNTYADASGNGNAGTAVGAPTFGSGKIGSGSVLVTSVKDGSAFNYVTLGTPEALNFGGSQDFSVSLWVNFTNWTGDPSFIANKNWNSGGNVGWVLATAGNGGFQWNFKDGTGRKDYDGPGGTLAGSGWHHLAVTWERAGNAVSYLDGVQVDSRSIAPGADTLDSGLPTNIGQDGTGEYTDNGSVGIDGGLIDDVGIWRRLLTASEVARIFAAAQNNVNLSSVPDPTGAFVASSSPIDKATKVSPSAVVFLNLQDGSTAVVTNTVQLFFDNVKVTPTITKSASTITLVTFDPPGLLAPLSVHSYRIIFSDSKVPPVSTTNTYQFTVSDYVNLALPSPIAFESFDSTAEGSLPAGWSTLNFTADDIPGPDLDNPHSDSFKDWVVISRQRVQAIGVAGGFEGTRRLQVIPNQIVNGAEVTNLVDGNFIYAESDVRSGGQVQYLFSPDFNLSGKSNIYVVYYSAYEQNQDNIGSLEYSVDGGTNWLPIVYMIDRDDIIRDAAGNIDAEATLNEPRGDAAVYVDPDTGEAKGGPISGYGAFIAAPISTNLAAYISGRINDDQVESKRVEKFRLPAADNQAKVRFRFAQAGTASWYWGVDNFGVYSISPVAARPAKPVLTGPASVTFLSTSNIVLSGSAFSGGQPSDTQISSVWQISSSPAFSSSNGFSAVLISVSGGASLTSLSTSIAANTFPGGTYYATVQYQDQAGVKSDFADPISFTVSTLPAPIAFENFESTPDFSVPAGWTASNQTDVVAAGSNPDDPNSDTYLGWVVVPFATLTRFGDARPDTNVVSGKSFYSESDNRGGNQIDTIISPDFNLSGKSGVWLAFKSSWVQNQDSFGVLEYSIDKGSTWLPVQYLINDKASNTDIKRKADGSIDATATLTTTATDIAKIIDPATGARVTAGKYADFVLAAPIDSLAPYISGRIDDDRNESKRYERYRLPAADNQSSVRLRFVYAGTGSWWWGLDDLGFYATGPDVTPGLRITSITAKGTGATIEWTGGTGPYLVQRKLSFSNTNWANLLTTSDQKAVVTLDVGAAYYRVSDKATTTVTPFTVWLGGDAEVPAVNTAGSGLATISVEGTAMWFTLNYSGLSGAATAGHFHGPATSTTVASPVINFSSLITSPGNSGLISAVATLGQDHIASLNAGLAYANLHTAANGGGEIRGHVVAARLKASLSGAGEVPAVNTTATGSAQLWLAGNQLFFNITYSGLSGPATLAHIHGPAGPAATASPIIDLAPFKVGAFGTSGAIAGSVTLTRAQYNAIADGMTYVNIHTAANGGGEIRGQIVPQ